ncbi:MAG: hypothetical protein LBQ43_01400, partial [Holosporales bacterium]|nr:hypothetical protein [Holosporales bacterium]
KDYYIRAGEQGHSFATEAIGRVNYKLINSRPPRAIEVERPAHRLYQAATVGEVQPQALTIDRTRPQAITIVMSRATTSDRPE